MNKLSGLINPQKKIPLFLKHVKKGQTLFHVLYGEVVVTDNNGKGLIVVRNSRKSLLKFDYRGILWGTDYKYPSLYVQAFELEGRMLKLPTSEIDMISKDEPVFVSNDNRKWESAHYCLSNDLFYVYPLGTTSFTSKDNQAIGYRYLKMTDGRKFYCGDLKNRGNSVKELDFSNYEKLFKAGYVAEDTLPQVGDQASIVKENK